MSPLAALRKGLKVTAVSGFDTFRRMILRSRPLVGGKRAHVVIEGVVVRKKRKPLAVLQVLAYYAFEKFSLTGTGRPDNVCVSLGISELNEKWFICGIVTK